MMNNSNRVIRNSIRSAAVLVFLAGAAPTWAGAGKAGHGHGHGDHGAMGAIGEAGKAADVTRTITVTMIDNLYDPENITVKAGETIRFKIVNKGEFLHEFGLGTAAMHKKHQAEMMKMWEHGMIEADRINHDKMKMDHGDGHAMKHDDPNSILLEPGKSGEIIWKFTQPTKLEFACNIPGHYESGMMGEIRFK